MLLFYHSLIFTTIADDAATSGKRIVTVFEEARSSIEDLSKIEFTFDDSFTSQLNSDLSGLIELQEKVRAGQDKTSELISSTLTQNASQKAYDVANRKDFIDLNFDEFINDQKKAHIAMLAMDKSLENCASLIDGYNQALKKADGGHQAFIDGISISNKELGSYLTGLNGAEGSIKGYQGALNKAKATTIAFKAATVALNVVLSYVGTVALSMAISKLYEWATANERAREAAEDGANEYQNAVSSIDNYASRIEELRKKIDDSNTSEQDAYDAKKELLSIQQQLAESYGSQTAGLNLLNGELREQIDLVRQLTKADAEKFLNENRSGIAEAKKKMTSDIGFLGKGVELGRINKRDTPAMQELMEILGKYDNIELKGESDISSVVDIKYRGNPEEAKEDINSIMTEVEKLREKYGDDVFATDDWTLNTILENSETQLGKVNEILDKYQDIYKQAQEARLVADQTLFKVADEDYSPAELLSEYAQAIEEYNIALASGDTSKITEAANKFIGIDRVVNSLLESGALEKHEELFLNAREQLDELAVKQQEFSEQMQDDKALGDYAKAIKELEMTDTEFLNISVDTSSVAQGAEDVWKLIEAAKSLGLITDATPEQLEGFADYLVKTGILKSVKAEAEKKPISFSDFFKKDNGISDQLSTELEKIETLKETMKSVMSGEFDESSLFALMEDFPDAINHTGNMMEYLKGQIEEIIGASDDLGTEINESSGIIKILDDAIAEAADNPEAVASLTQLKNLVLELAYATAEDFTINIEVEKSSLEALRTAIDEARSAAGLTQESVEALQNRYKDIAGFNPLELFESTNTGLYLNNGVLADLEEAYEKNKFEKIGNQLAYLKEQLVYAGSGAEHDFILEQITKLELLEAQYVGLTSEYNKWTQAQSSANDRDMYESVTGGKESVGKLIEQGWAKSDDVTSYLKLLTGKEIDDLTAQQIKELYESLDKNIQGTKFSIFDFFTTDKDGNVTSEGVANFFDAVKQKLEGTELGKSVLQKDGSFNFLGDNMENVAKELGISVELMEILLRAAQEAGAEVEFDSMFTGLDESTAKIDTLKQKLDELGKSYVEIDIYTNKENLASEIDKAKTEYQKAFASGDKDLMEYYGAAIDTMVARKNYKNFMGVDTSQLEGDMQKGMELLQKWQTAKNEAESADYKGDKDTQFEAEQQVQDLEKQLDSLSPEIKAKLGFEEGDTASSFLSKIEQGTLTVDIQAILSEANKSDIQMMYEMNGKTLTANMNVEGNVKEVIDSVNSIPLSKTISIDAQFSEHFAGLLRVISELNTFNPVVTIDAKPGESIDTVKSDLGTIGTGIPAVQINVNLDSTSKAQTTSDINAIGSDKTPVSISVELDGTESTVTTTINDIGSDKSPVKIGVELDGTQTTVATSINDIGANAQPATITVILDPTTQSQVTTDINAIGANAQPANIIVSVNKTQLTQLDTDVSKQRTANVVTVVYKGQLSALDNETSIGYDTDVTVNVLRGQFDTLKTEVESGLNATVNVALNPEDPLGEIKQYAGQRDSNTNPNGTPKNTGGVINNPTGTGSSSYGLGSQVKFENPLEKVEDKEATLEVEVEGQDDVDAMTESIEILDDHQFNVEAGVSGLDELKEMQETHSGITDLFPEVEVSTSGIEDLRILKSEISTVKGKDVDVTAHVHGTEDVWNLVDAINAVQSKSVTIEAHVENNLGSGDGEATGTAYSRGTTKTSGKAYAEGDWGTKSSGRALVGELGQELLVRNGHFYTIGDNSAEFVNYKKGDIIFNHEQTKQIFEHGRILYGQKRAHALAGGTAFATGNAFAGSTTNGASSSSSILRPSKPSVSSLSSGKASKNQRSSGGDSESKEEWFDWIEIAIDRIERAIDNLELKATSVFRTWGERTSNLRNEMKLVTDEIKLQKKAYDRYIEEANNVGLDAKYAKMVRDGAIDIELINDEDLIQKIKDYQEWYEKALDCHYAVDELNESLAQLHKQNFDNVISKYDNFLSVIENEKSLLEESIDQSEEQGYIVSIEYYEALMERERNSIKQLTKQKTDMQKALNEAVASGTVKEYSQAWYEMNNEINNVSLSIEEANTSLIKYNNSIREIEWETFDLLQNRISHVIEETEFLVDLLSEDKLHEDGGQLTDEGMAVMGMHGMAYNTYMEQAKRYAQELKAIEEDISKDPNNQDLLDRRQDLLEAQRDSILGAKNERQAIVDLVEEGINLELEALEKRIDKYNESLESAKELYEYQKKIQESTKEIASLEKQMMAYQGDDSEETKAKIQELKVSLDEARTNLEETEYDHYIDDTEKMLDDLYSEYEELLNMRLDDIDTLVSDMIDEINSNSSMINETLNSLSEEFGFELSNILSKTWSGDGDVVTVYDEGIMNSIENASTQLSKELISIDEGIWGMVASLDKMANKDISNTSKNVKGYASGAYRISRNQLAWTQENRNMEAIIRPSDGAILTPLMRNDSILNARATSNLFDLANDPNQFIKDHLNLDSFASVTRPTTTFGNTYDNDFAIQFSLPNVSNYEQFIRAMQNDKNFERMIKSMTVDKLFGESSMNKYRF